ncbi:MAG: hypothetical protein WBK28_00660 [Minisyncoccia bacterium]
MNERSERFYFANLTADVARCVHAAQKGDEDAYQQSLLRAYRTLQYLRPLKNRSAYEEGLLLVRGLFFAKEAGTLETFSVRVNMLGAEFSPLISA